MSEKRVSFKFNKRSSRGSSMVRVDGGSLTGQDFITFIADGQIQSQNSKPVARPVEKKDYYVPLIKKVNWRGPSHQQGAQSNKSEEELELDKEAAAAIMKDLQEAGDNPEYSDILLKEAGDDVELRHNQSTLHDYNDMPVSQFGIACLRGMGWKKSEGIGLTNKRCVEPIELNQRPVRQGLGAERKKRKLNKR